ncbi:DedA family protein [Paenibacillus sediminis]|uniref:Membrane protein DedA with SNARE-associated domain n=1 Tax=Paenibacillus sediminis TaxID=664909 RepID=A0ABS4H0U6_9BACL|nr:DedA family protein [Paenibacillus sediminis]MBP1936152.1 membrane protein DedA with SNARE-associated domain [Paenibacillus sediminis]
MEHFLSELITKYGYIGIFTALALGIVGLPVPDELLMTYVGYNVYLGRVSYPLAYISAILGAMTGITISYIIGAKLGLPFLKRFGPKIRITHEKIERTHNLFEKYGNILLFVGYFIPGVRHLTAYMAGISSLDFRKFMLYAYSGALVWGITFISLGHVLGEKWYLGREYIHRYGLYVLILCVIVAIGAVVYFNFKKPKATL